MKKLISVALAGVMALSLAACGSTPASEPASGSTAASRRLRLFHRFRLGFHREQAVHLQRG